MKVTKRQLRKMVKEATWYQEKAPAVSSMAQGQIDDLNYFQDQVEEAYARLAAELNDVEDILPEHVLAKINAALNSLEDANNSVARFIKKGN